MLQSKVRNCAQAAHFCTLPKRRAQKSEHKAGGQALRAAYANRIALNPARAGTVYPVSIPRFVWLNFARLSSFVRNTLLFRRIGLAGFHVDGAAELGSILKGDPFSDKVTFDVA